MKKFYLLSIFLSVQAFAQWSINPDTNNALCKATGLQRHPPIVNDGAGIDSLSFAAKVDFSTSFSTYSVAIGDLDGDSKQDLAVANYDDDTISVLRNTSTTGIITSNSFSKVNVFAKSSLTDVAIRDIDGDGKPDLIAVQYNGSTVYVCRNISTSGNISFATGVGFFIGGSPTTVAVADLDGDGKPDVVTANFDRSNVSVLRNTSTSGNISFAARSDLGAGSLPEVVALGDIDGDGKPDIVVTDGVNSGKVSVLRNTSTSGTISFDAKIDFTTGSQAIGVAIGDQDGDGKPDLAVVNSSSNTVSLLRNTSTSGSISFASKVDVSTGRQPEGVAIADLDGDGKPDLAIANYSDNTVSVLQNTSTSGNISFVAKVDFATGFNPRTVAIGDMDGDGKLDLVTANYNLNGNVSVLRNTSVTVDVTEPEVLPARFHLSQNYPNPFNPATTIKYELPSAMYVSLKIYDVLGQEVAILVNGMQEAGYKSVEFNAGNFPSGIYMYRLTAGNFADVKRLLLIK